MDPDLPESPGPPLNEPDSPRRWTFGANGHPMLRPRPKIWS